ncbi:MAG TPA: hypothetical protein EYN28_03060 [Flavobacteriales bacterium]|nr:hypothetical protein [Flavobacteriales bacterium]
MFPNDTKVLHLKHAIVFCTVRKFLLTLLSLLAFNIPDVLAQTSLLPFTIQGNWYCIDSAAISVPGRLPGSLHNALISSGIIPDPFVGTNEDSVQWVGRMDWKFISEPFEKPHEGDFEVGEVLTYSEWSLNGVKLGETDNAFRPWEFGVREAIRPTNNILSVVFTAPSKVAESRIKNANHPLPGDAERAVHRAPQFTFGWDWAMTLVDCSVGAMGFKGEDLDFAISQIDVQTDTIEGTTARGFVTFRTESKLENDGLLLRWALSDPLGKMVAAGKFRHEVGEVKIPFKIENALLWWTHDLGEPNLHTLEIVAVGDKGLIAREKQVVGLRTLRLDTSKDKEDSKGAKGAKFQWVLNNVPIFAGGSNVVPADLISNRIRGAEDVALVENAVKANMNTLRIWGGGTYASDEFMNACDKMGVLVWHDFMFACAMYPGDTKFLESVSKETTYQTTRLRHHPSLAMWCGNNEVSEGWERWGWKVGLSELEIGEIEKSYDRIFNELLPSIVSEIDDAPYWESSPMLGRGDSDFVNRGDAHDWGIWHDGYSFDSLWTRVPRFMSEFGFQSFPEKSTFSTVVNYDSILSSTDRTSAELISHEKHSRGFDIIDAYLVKPFGGDLGKLSFDQWTYLTQLLQAKGISDGVRAARLNQDHCSGSLVWQLNDCQPIASWSSIDSHGKWKLLHHELKDAFAPTLLYGVWESVGRGSKLKVGLVANPNPNLNSAIPGTLRVSLVGLDGDVISSNDHAFILTPGTPNWIVLEDVVGKRTDLSSTFVQLSWTDNSCIDKSKCELGASAVVWAIEPKDIKLQKANISVEKLKNQDDGSVLLMIESDVFAKSVQLEANMSGNFEDNGFDLLPGEQRILKFTPHNLATWGPELSSNSQTRNVMTQLFVTARSLSSVL